MELTTLYPTLAFIAIILFGLSFYFSKRTTPKRKVNKSMVDQILGVKTQMPTVQKHHTDGRTETPARSAPDKKEEVKVNPLTQVPILTKGKNASTDKSHVSHQTPLKEPSVTEGGWTQLTLFENTPQNVAGVKVLITLIRQDSDGKMRASLSYYDRTGTENDFRVSQGDLVNINNHPCKVEKINYVDNNRGNIKIKLKTVDKK